MPGEGQLFEGGYTPLDNCRYNDYYVSDLRKV